MAAVEAIGSSAVAEYFVLDHVVLSRDGLRGRGILPLRGIPLGDGPNLDSARVLARSRRAWDADAVVAENVRTAVERNAGLVFGLTQEQVDRLRRGETLWIDDGLGRIEVSYRREPEISDEAFEKRQADRFAKACAGLPGPSDRRADRR